MTAGTTSATTPTSTTLTSTTRWLLAGHAVSALGSGLTYPLMAIFVQRPERAGESGTVWYFLVLAVAGVAGAWLARMLRRWWGAVVAVGLGLALQGAGMLWLPVAHGLASTAISAVLCGTGAALAWTCLGPLLVVAQEERAPDGRGGPSVDRAFALRGMVMSLGLGVGGALAALVLHGNGQHVFPILFVLDGVSYLVFGVLIGLRIRGRGADEPPRPRRKRDRTVLRDRAFLGLLYGHAMYVTVGMSLFDTAIPLLIVTRLGEPAWVMGLLIALLMVGVVVLQLPVSSWLGRLPVGWRLPAMGTTGMAGYLVFAGATQVTQDYRLALLVASCLLFVVTACGFSGCFHPIVLAVVGRRRYLDASALVSASYNLALLGGPPLGVLLVSGLPPLVPCLLWAGGMMSLIVVAVLTR